MSFRCPFCLEVHVGLAKSIRVPGNGANTFVAIARHGETSQGETLCASETLGERCAENRKAKGRPIGSVHWSKDCGSDLLSTRNPQLLSAINLSKS